MHIHRDIACPMFQYLWQGCWFRLRLMEQVLYTVFVDLHGGFRIILSSVYIQWWVSWRPVLKSSHVCPVNCPPSSLSLRMVCVLLSLSTPCWWQRLAVTDSHCDQRRTHLMISQTQHLLCVSCSFIQNIVIKTYACDQCLMVKGGTRAHWNI